MAALLVVLMADLSVDMTAVPKVTSLDTQRVAMMAETMVARRDMMMAEIMAEMMAAKTVALTVSMMVVTMVAMMVSMKVEMMAVLRAERMAERSAVSMV